MTHDFNILEKKIGAKFNNLDLLREALTHRSYLNENPSLSFHNNERLEFMGDAVLELVVTEELFKRYPKKEEGEMTIYRAALVNSKMLREAASEINLNDEILVSKGVSRDIFSREGETILANAVEALIGAIYLDKGYEESKKFIERFIISHLEQAVKNGAKDFKSLIQEIAQDKYRLTPTYKVLEELGPAHDRKFKVGLYFGDEFKIAGEGSSKQEAELKAAGKLLSEFGTNNI